MNEASEIETRQHEDRQRGPGWLLALQLEKRGPEETSLPVLVSPAPHLQLPLDLEGVSHLLAPRTSS